MRTTIIPAQITTVEDKIAGNLNLTQIILLLIPIFSGSAIYILFPPFSEYALYKLIVILCIAAVSCGCAIRFKEKMVLQWIGILVRYSNRPRYYLYNKNDLFLRENSNTKLSEEKTIAAKHIHKINESKPANSLKERIKLDLLIDNPKANISFKPTRKGGMYVSISEIK